MLNAQNIQIRSQFLSLIAEIDEFKGAWRALGQLAPGQLQLLKRVATIESIGSSTRIEGSKLSDQQVEALLSNLQAKYSLTQSTHPKTVHKKTPPITRRGRICRVFHLLYDDLLDQFFITGNFYDIGACSQFRYLGHYFILHSLLVNQPSADIIQQQLICGRYSLQQYIHRSRRWYRPYFNTGDGTIISIHHPYGRKRTPTIYIFLPDSIQCFATKTVAIIVLLVV